MTFARYMRGLVNGFRKDERGSLAVEAIIIIPMVFWTFLSMFAVFHAFRTYAVNQKAAYTIGDMISRETNPIDQDYLNGVNGLLGYLTVANANDVSVRVTSVRYDAVNDVYKRDWSHTSGFLSPVGNNTVLTWRNQLPVMPHNERVVVVETQHNYDPPFNTGLVDRQVSNFVFTKPRYAPQVLWTN